MLSYKNLLAVDDVESLGQAIYVSPSMGSEFPSTEVIYSPLPLRGLGGIDSCRYTSDIDMEDDFGCCYVAIVVLIAESLTQLIYLAVLAVIRILTDGEGESPCIEFRVDV